LRKAQGFLPKKLKEFCQKLIYPATLSWWWLLKNGQKEACHIISRIIHFEKKSKSNIAQNLIPSSAVFLGILTDPEQ